MKRFRTMLLHKVTMWAFCVFALIGGVGLFIPLISTAQEIAPANPAFVQYMENLRMGRLRGSSDGEFGLGLIPPPIDLSHMQGQRVAISGNGEHPRDSYPLSYDLRSLGRVTAVRNQGSCGCCWAFASSGSLESNLLSGETWDFSEQHLKNTHGFDWGHCAGGNASMATAYFARWSGPVRESDDPYNPTGSSSPSGLAVPKHVQNVLFLPRRGSSTDNDNLKDAIMTYGGVYASMKWDAGQYNAATHAYYWHGGTRSNHAIVLVGWDDTYSRSNFSTPPAGNGAFLVRNSWGSSWGDHGYFWISYYDTVLAKTSEPAVFVHAEAADNYDHLYQYDPLGAVRQTGFSASTGWFANIFRADSDEMLKAVSFYTASPNSTYEIYMYLNPNNGPINATGYALVQSGTLAVAGYHTVVLTSGVPVFHGQTFSAVVKLTTPGYNYPIPIESPNSGYSSAASAHPGESYISSNGSSWSDYGAGGEKNVCLKVFSQDVVFPTPTPTATPTPTPIPTYTPTPVPTVTPTPIPTHTPTPVPTATPTPLPTTTPTPPPTPTPTHTPTPVPTATPTSGVGDYHAYLAEGYTNGGFETYLALLNPHPSQVQVDVTFLKEDGTTLPYPITMGPNSRRVIATNSLLPNQGFSTEVASTRQIAVERSMYWPAGGVTQADGHASAGMAALSTEWYLAEGYNSQNTRDFETFLLLVNPHDEPANVDVTFLKEDGTTQPYFRVVPPHSRSTILTKVLIPAGGFATTCHANRPILVERAMYWTAGGVTYAGGHDTMAASQLATTWYLAEGYNSQNSSQYETFIMLMNPHDEPANVDVTFMKEDGTTQEYFRIVPPRSRSTILTKVLIPSGGFATKLRANRPILVERAMYWSAGGVAQAGGHDTLGIATLAAAWYLAEGYNSTNSHAYKTYIMLFNPNPTDAQVQVTFIKDDGASVSYSKLVPARSRRTVLTNSLIPSGGFGAIVRANVPLAVERAMYWNAGGVTNAGGHCSVGVPYQAGPANAQLVAQTQYTVTVTLAGSGSGSVVGSGIDCGTVCTSEYQEGTVLHLKAIPDEGSVFSAWLVNGEPITGPLSVGENMIVTAVFEAE